jgi:hypothetical protein
MSIVKHISFLTKYFNANMHDIKLFLDQLILNESFQSRNNNFWINTNRSR